MTTVNKQSARMAIKDFKVPAPDGTLYDMSDETTLRAIDKFCLIDHHFCEHKPNFKGLFGQTDPSRVFLIDLKNCIATIKDLKFDKGSMVLIGTVEPLYDSHLNPILKKLESGECRFTMRSKVTMTRDKLLKIKSIVGFNIV